MKRRKSTSGGSFLTILLLFAFPQVSRAPIKVECTATDLGYMDTYDAKTKKKSEIPLGWKAACELSRGKDSLWKRELVLGHPATRKEALNAIDEFMESDELKGLLKKYAK